MAEGNPVATEVLTGNAADLSTFESQVKKRPIVLAAGV
jgi:hypothetical protein